MIFGIETSCDETACAIVRDGREVLASAVATQIAKHAAHGGVVPELAAREHLEALDVVAEEAFRTAGVGPESIDAVAVTNGPGLMPALLVGVSYAKGLAVNWGRPLIGCNHFMAHIYGAFLHDDGYLLLTRKETYPILALVVSGGHSSLVLIEEDGKATHLGCTIDDAAGEALDKGSKLLGLGYPGGPAIQKAAAGGDVKRYHFPRPLTGTAGKALALEHQYNFSFSGVKTALLYQVREARETNADTKSDFIRDISASYQEAIVDVLSRKAIKAARDFNAHTVVVAGGVACNGELRRRMQQLIPPSMLLRLAEPRFCTDNAAMVGGLGYYYFRDGVFSPLSLDAFARLPKISRVPFAAVAQ